MTALLTIDNLSVTFSTLKGTIKALSNVNLEIKSGETHGLVGESGCGKTVTSLSVMRLLPETAQIAGGEIFFDGNCLLKKTETEMTEIRGRDISMIFQEPMTSLNPVLTVGDQIGEVFELHRRKSTEPIPKKVSDVLRSVEMPDPERIMRSYPSELSGGMRQRIMIAMAIACKPKLLIADEPTSALDVTVQAQILKLMRRLKEESGSSIIFVTHNLAVVAEMCDSVSVMYGGRVVESADIETIFEAPLHPYSVGLLNSIPSTNRKQERLQTIVGSLPDPTNLPPGCVFCPRCSCAKDICKSEPPKLTEKSSNHYVMCHMA